MRVSDWRLKHKSYYTAYMKGALRPNDMNYINSMLGFIICFLVLTLINMIVMGAGLGFISCQPIFYVCVLFLIATTVIYQSRPFYYKELVYWGLVNIIYLGVGILFFIYQYEVSEFTIDVT
jgi:hypothetical protein